MSVSQLSREEKLLEKRKEKALAKKREEIYNEMLEKDYVHRKEQKIAPEGYCISLKDINKIYPNHVQAVYDFNLDIKPQEFIVLVGPSGCGKSTTLRMIAGLEDITYGDLYISKQFANDLLPKQRDVAMVFQNYALYPNLTVYDNLAFSLKVRHIDPKIIEEKVLEAANILELTDYLKRKPAALSGGQKQRVALGRAIVRNANVFLMDEPLSNLDAKLRIQMRSEIVKIHKRTGATTVYVTHDQTEAMTMADRIVVMKDGRVQQIGTPRETYNYPANTFVAAFIGSPAMNLINAKYNNGTVVLNNGYELKMSDENIKNHDKFYVDLLCELETKLNNYNKSLEERRYAFEHPEETKEVEKLTSLKLKFTHKIADLEEGIRRYKGSCENLENDSNLAKMEAKLNACILLRDKKVKSMEEKIKSNKAAREEALVMYPLSEEKLKAFNESVEQKLANDNLAYYYLSRITSTKEKIEKVKNIITSKNHDIIFGVRPEDIISGKLLKIVDNPSKPQPFKITLRELLGNEYFLHLDVEGKDVVAKLPADENIEGLQTIDLSFNLDHIHLFDPVSTNRIF